MRVYLLLLALLVLLLQHSNDNSNNNIIKTKHEENQVKSLEQMRQTALFGDESIWTSNWTNEEVEISNNGGAVTQHHFISGSDSSGGMGRSSLEES